ncbi:methylated-DNA--[protein]-cysteine S-methyltransferase [Cohnella nanjingensis]|uniref:Methylated-DNA--protein-cysteine methyltransferase n=2 Tax=Cohnella nanjingensis TaxID=1387779 RepID=A0A7X0VGW6_9BACL|nr:methylated-DNA--[protein]-cysteine S-methyltransferase [Cohnella nanjingensis]
MDSPLGKLTLCRTDAGICRVEFGGWETRSCSAKAWAHRWWPSFAFREDAEDEVLREAVSQLRRYFAGELQAFDLPLDMRGTPFQRKVWQALRDVPYGATAAYRDIAAAVGAPQAVRAVGGANNRNPVPIVVPCHRIIGANGAMVGYGGGLAIKERLLALEDGAPAAAEVLGH